MDLKMLFIISKQLKHGLAQPSFMILIEDDEPKLKGLHF